MSIQRYSELAGSALEPDADGYWVKFKDRLTPAERRVLLAARGWVVIVGQRRPSSGALTDAVTELCQAVAALAEERR